MSAQRPSQSEWFERVVRSLLAVALLAAVAWAVTDGGTRPSVFFDAAEKPGP